MVAFDPSSAGTGRMILELAKGVSNGDFKDAAVNIYGSRITGTGVSETDVQNIDFRTGVNQKYRAGIQATMRIENSLAKTVLGAEWATHAASTGNRLGLVVMNYNRSFPRLANNYDGTVESGDPDVVYGLTNSKWFTANTVQTGFVLGNNGMIDVAHSRFLDYFAAGATVGTDEFPVAGVHVKDEAAVAADGTHHESKIKKHNPSALIVDGHVFRATGTTISKDTNYAYDSNDIAQIQFEGNAGMFVRVAASSSTGTLINFGINADGTTGATATYVDGTIGKGTYDGKVINVMDGAAISTHQSSSLDGEIALDVEGKLRIKSTEAVTESHAPAGFINVPTVLLDHHGQELAFTSSALTLSGARPLSMSTENEYYRYNTSSVMLNDQVELEYVTWIHNDLSRDQSDLPNASARPAIFGGELPSLRVAQHVAIAQSIDPDVDLSTLFLDYTGTRLFLDNSTVACHESLVSAGMRWVVRDGLIDLTVTPADTLDAGDNSSFITLYNKGDAYDLAVTERGRVFQLGSRANVMADGITNALSFDGGVTYPRSSLRDAYIDVYRQEPIPSSLVVDGDEKNTMRFTINSAAEAGVGASEKAMHLLYLVDRSQVNLGWSAGQYDESGTPKIEVDLRYRPWEYSPAVLAYVRELDPANDNNYRFNPYSQGHGELVLAADNLYVSAGGRFNAIGILDPADNEIPPYNIAHSGGILFANHGGTLKTSGTADVLIDTVIGRRTSALPAGRGVVELANDQTLMQDSGKIITYGYDPLVDAQPALAPGALPVATFNVADIPVPEGFTSVKGFI